MRGADGVAWFGAMPGCSIAMYIAYAFSAFAFVMPLAMSGGRNVEATMLVMLTVLLLAGAAGGTGAWFLTRWGARLLIARSHARTWYELHRTNFMTLVVDDSYTRVIQERVELQWALRWLAPPPPKRLEDQLEYAACYQLALRRMLGGVGRLENGPLWQGGVTWSAGGTRGVTCGCTLLGFLSWIGLALITVGAVFYLQRCGALIAYCDFLLYEERLRRDLSPPAPGP